jgi:eukaryotic-like serine/threonine-protein kinase
VSRKLCPDCGKPFPSGAPVGMCPNCLLRLGLLSAPAPTEPVTVCHDAPGLGTIASLSRPAAEAAGARIGHYKLLEPIGEGGFGTVWMAEQTEPVRRKVALKIIKLGMDTREVVARFEAERQALALMDHPNIARVFDGGTTESGRPYFVMELVKGVRITEYCDAKRLSTEERLKLFIQVCQAVQHAHQKGVIHRDLKPNNVLVTEQDGRAVPKVIDFGIAKATGTELTEKTLFTRFNQVIGTPAYMSPEQAGLGSLDVDTRSDIYALGVLLYELLTGRTPFSNEDLLKAGLDEVLRTIREKEPPKPSTKLGTLTPEDLQSTAQRRAVDSTRLPRLVRGELDWIVMKCLEKNRARRYETANGLARDIERHLHNEPVAAVAPSLTYQLTKFARRYRAGLAVASSFVLVLMAGVVATTWQAVRASRLAESEARHRRSAELNHYAADMRAAQLALADGNLREARARLDRHRPEAGDMDLRSLEWWFLTEQARGEETRIFQFAERRLGRPAPAAESADMPVRGLTISKDGKWLAASNQRGKVRVWRLENGALAGEWQGDDSGRRSQLLEFSPDSRWLVCSCAGGARLVAAGDWTGAKRLEGDGEHARFAPDGSRLGVAWRGHLRIFDLQNGEAHDIPEVPLPPSVQFEFCGSGNEVVGFGNDGKLALYDLRSGTCRRLPGVATALTSLAVSADGRWLAAGGWTGEVTIWNLATTSVHRTWKAHLGLSFGLAFSHDSAVLATAGSDQAVRLWNVTIGAPVRSLRGNLDEVWRLRFSPDDRRVYTASKDGVVCEFQVAGLEPPPAVPEFRWEFGWTRYSADKQRATLVYREAAYWEVRDASTLAVVNAFEVPVQEERRAGWLVSESTGTWLAVGTKSGEIVILSASSGQIRRRHQLTSAPLQVVAVSDDASQAVTFVREAGPRAALTLWNLVTGAREATFEADADDRFGVVFSHDGRRLVVPKANSDALEIWSIPERRSRHRLEGHRSWLGTAAFSSDDQLLATCGQDASVCVWQVATGRMVTPPLLGHYSGVTTAFFVNGGRTLLTSGSDLRIRVWDVPTGQSTLVLPGYLLYASEDMLARVTMEQFRMPSPGDRAKGEVLRFGQAAAKP